MLNSRVHDLGAMVVRLRAARKAVEVDSEVRANGRIARLKDRPASSIELGLTTGRGGSG